MAKIVKTANRLKNFLSAKIDKSFERYLFSTRVSIHHQNLNMAHEFKFKYQIQNILDN